MGLVSSRRSAHPRRTVAAPTPHLCSPSLTHCSGCSLLSSTIPVLATRRAPCPLESVNFRQRTLAQWRGARAGSLGCKTGSRDDAMPSPPTVAYKALPAALALCAPSSLPVYLIPVVLVNRLAVRFRCLQQDRATLSFRVSLPSPLFQVCPRTSLRLSCSPSRQQCRRRSLRKISSSEPVRRVLGSTRRLSMALEFRNTFNPRQRRTTRAPWIYGMGKFTALGFCAFPKKPAYLTHPTDIRSITLALTRTTWKR